MRLLRIPRATAGAELSLVDHLDELRLRIVSSVAALGVAFGVCLWQNHALLAALTRPLGDQKPVTFGVAESFTTTLTVSAYAALVLALPVVLYQVYAFALPALRPGDARHLRPLLFAAPVLFAAGACFAYFLVLPAAIAFLLHFNDDQFRILIRARDYYGFVGQMLLALGLLFQVPVVVTLLARLGILTAGTLRGVRRYAYVGCVIAAMLLPGVDPVTMLIETVPIVALYELSIVLAALMERLRRSRGLDDPLSLRREPRRAG
jgi:sec-independent protein translocase protein TatC